MRCIKAKHDRLETLETSEGRVAKEHVEFDARSAREHAKYKTRDIQDHVRHVIHKTTFGTRHAKHIGHVRYEARIA